MTPVVVVFVKGSSIVEEMEGDGVWCRSARGTSTRVTESWWPALRRESKITDFFVVGAEAARWVLVVMDFDGEDVC